MVDKVENLRRGMQVLGTLDSAYWASWLITSLILLSGLIIETIILGKYILQINPFIRVPSYILFFFFFIPGIVYLIMAFFFTTILSNKTQAFAACFAILLNTLILASMFTSHTI